MNIGEIVIYGTSGVCRITGKETRAFGDTAREYYLLSPLSAKHNTVIFVPVDNEALLANMHNILSAEELAALIPTVTPFSEEEWGADTRTRSKRCKEVLSSGDRMQLLRLVRTVLGNETRTPTNSEDAAAHRAASMLFEELSLVLDITEEEVIPLLLGDIPVKAKE